VLGKRNERKRAAVKIYKSMAKKNKIKEMVQDLVKVSWKIFPTGDSNRIPRINLSRNDQLFPNFLSQFYHKWTV
jgi:hypothetical protein